MSARVGISQTERALVRITDSVHIKEHATIDDITERESFGHKCTHIFEYEFKVLALRLFVGQFRKMRRLECNLSKNQ